MSHDILFRVAWFKTGFITNVSLALATHLHGKNIDKGFIRIDMSEFQHKVSLSDVCVLVLLSC